MKSLKVSILMPVYNEEKYIEDAIHSIFSYDYSKLDNLDIELIIVDDFSTDRTYDIVYSLSKKNSNIKVLRNTIKGKNHAINMAYDSSCGSYICFMGGDDLIEPKTLGLRVRTIIDNQEDNVSLSYSCCKIKTFSTQKRYDSIVIPKSPNLGSSSGGAIMLTRALANKIFPLPNNLPNEDSWILYYLTFFNIRRVEVPSIGLYYRIHQNNSHKRDITFDKHRKQYWDRNKAIIMFYNRYHEDLDEIQEHLVLKKIFLSTAVRLNQTLPLLLTTQASLKQKIKGLSDSISIIYKIRTRLYKYLIGR